MLQVDLDRFSFKEKVILKNIRFCLENGKSLTVTGANGVGKSTLAKIICALYQTEKAVKINGSYLHELSASQRASQLNYIPPKPEIYDEYITVEEYLGLSVVRGDIERALEETGLERLKGAFCKDLSSGEAQLLLIASAICHNAKLTLFDEPISNLDPKRAGRVFRILKGDLFSQKIVITHNLQFAFALGYGVLYLHDSGVRLYERCDDFFDKENLRYLFADSVVKKDDLVVTRF